MESTQILLTPVVTEKSNARQAKHVYTFFVSKNANKIEIAQAVAQAYGVKVKHVRIIQVLPKNRMVARGRSILKRQAAKKALVTIAPKQVIDVNKFSKK